MPTLIDFYADWCKPCMDMMPVMEEIEAENRVEVHRINADTQPELVAQYDVKGLPTLILAHEGTEISRHVGSADKDKIDRMIVAGF